MRNAAEKTYRALALESPNDRPLIEEFGIVLRDSGRNEEAAALFEKNGLLEEAGWNYYAAGRFDDANKIADRLLSQKRTFGVVYLKIEVEDRGFEDLTAALTACSQFTSEELLSD